MFPIHVHIYVPCKPADLLEKLPFGLISFKNAVFVTNSFFISQNVYYSESFLFKPTPTTKGVMVI